MLQRQQPQRGMNLVEVLVGIGIIGVLLALGAPSVRTWTQNTKIRGTAEAILNGLQLAKGEAVRRNTLIRFQPTSTLDAACVLGTLASSASYANWVVSYDDPAARCNSAPIDDVLNDPNALPPPRIIQKKAATEGSSGVVVAAAMLPTSAGISFIRFNGLGRLSPVTPNDVIICTGMDQTPPSTPVAIVAVGGVNRCATSTTERRMQVTVTQGGQIRMCDPARPATDPMGC